MNKWMRVEDGLPEIGVPVAVIHEDESFPNPWTSYLRSDENWFSNMSVTHWTPLPRLPEKL